MDYMVVGSIKANNVSGAGTVVAGSSLMNNVPSNIKSYFGTGLLAGDFGYMPAVGILYDPDAADMPFWNSNTFMGEF